MTDDTFTPDAAASGATRDATLGAAPPAADDVYTPPWLCTATSPLAAILDGEGKRDEAERLYLHALATFERTDGGESYDDVQARVRSLWAKLEARHRAQQERVLLIGHGGVR